MKFEAAIASRYLQLQRPRSLQLLLVPAVPAALLLALHGLLHMLATSQWRWLEPLRFQESLLRLVGTGLIVALVLVGYFVVLVRRLTVFTTISTYGLFLGAAALVVVLSVMSGFEQDLKHKILGANAHVVITRPDDTSIDPYQLQLDAAARVPGVVGATPFIGGEVMMASQSNLAGVILKGIDPATVGRVTDLRRNMDLGDLDYLTQPEKLRALGAAPPELEDPDPLDDADDDRPPGRARSPSSPSPSPSGKPKPKPKPKPRFVAAGSDGKALPGAEPHTAERKLLPGIIIGRELAKSLRLYLGDDVSVVSPFGGIGPSGPIPRARQFRVAGIFFSGFYEYDTKHVYMSIADAQKFLDVDGVSGIELKVADPDHTEAVVAGLRLALADPGGKQYEVQDWKDVNRSLFSALKVEKIAMFIVLCFIILVAAFSIIANGIMLVFEKGKEIAILKSMGMRDGAVLRVFVLLGLYMGAVGTLSGVAVGILGCWALGKFGLPLDPDVYYITQLPVQMNPAEIAMVCGAAVLLSALATIYPALLAARLRPVDGLRPGNR